VKNLLFTNGRGAASQNLFVSSIFFAFLTT
jgi:hypothetical protein